MYTLQSDTTTPPMASLPPPPLPPQVGMRFVPKDKELVNDFLAKYLQDVQLLPRHANISVLKDLYAYHPCRLFDMGGDPAGVNGDEDDEEEDDEEEDNGRRNNRKKQIRKRYFITPLKKVSTNGHGKRMVRTVEGFGTWKLEITKDVKDKGEVIGYRKYFKYEKKSDKKCKKRQHQEQEDNNDDDEWGMHEYTHVENSMFALCCITRKRTRTSSTSKRIPRANNNNNVNATSNNKEGDDVNNYSMTSSEKGIVVDHQYRVHHEVPSNIVANNSYYEQFKKITYEEALECIGYGVPIAAKPALDDNSIVEQQQQLSYKLTTKNKVLGGLDVPITVNHDGTMLIVDDCEIVFDDEEEMTEKEVEDDLAYPATGIVFEQEEMADSEEEVEGDTDVVVQCNNDIPLNDSVYDWMMSDSMFEPDSSFMTLEEDEVENGETTTVMNDTFDIEFDLVPAPMPDSTNQMTYL